jgi:predicted PurR-regulated permease PerM
MRILPEMADVPPLPEGSPAGLSGAPRPPGRRRLQPKHYLWVAGAVLVLAAMIHWLGAALTPFVIGAILAYLGLPIVRRCEKWGTGRTLGTLIAMFVIALFIIALFFVVVPLVQAEVSLVMRQVPGLMDKFTASAGPWLYERLGIELRFDLAQLKELIAENAESAKALSLQLLGGVKSGGLILITVLINLALSPVVTFFLLRDWQQIIDRIDDLMPRRWTPLVRTMARDIDHVLSEFLHAQMLVMVSLATYYAIALWIAGLQFAVPIGILTGLLVFIPYVGFGLGFTLGMAAALLQWNGLPGFLAILTVYGIGQLLENYVLIPYLVGQRIGLHPLAVIFALMAFAQLFGFVGVLLALPVSAVLLVGLRHLRASYLESPLYREP